MLRNGTELPCVKAQLEAFAEREEFSLGTVYVAQGDAPGAFHALMAEVTRDEGAWGVVVPDLRHVTVVEQLVLTRHEDGARTAILAANFSPRAGGPGALPDSRQVCLSTSPERGGRRVDELEAVSSNGDPHTGVPMVAGIQDGRQQPWIPRRQPRTGSFR